MSINPTSPYDEYQSPYPRSIWRMGGRKIYRAFVTSFTFLANNIVIPLIDRLIILVWRGLWHTRRHRHIQRTISLTDFQKKQSRQSKPSESTFRDLMRVLFYSFSFAFVAQLANTGLYAFDLTAYLITVGLLITLFLGLYLLQQVAYMRQRYVVLPFDTNHEELKSISELLKYHFISEIKRMSRLLSVRQIENINDNMWVSLNISTQNDELLKDLQSLALLNIDDKKDSKTQFFAGLLTSILRLLTIARISGYVEKRPSGGLHIRVDFAHRYRGFISVDILEGKFTDTDPLGDLPIQYLARQLATKLIYELGNYHQLAYSLTSLEHFLTGLQASVEKNWWRAADAYLANLQLEESGRGTFAIGHYHLGVAKISQGNITEGTKHLQRAEMGDSPLADAYYMLALLGLDEHYNHLHQRTLEFDRLIKRCKLALITRRDFPEAYYLMGTAYYRRGKLLDRRKIVENLEDIVEENLEKTTSMSPVQGEKKGKPLLGLTFNPDFLGRWSKRFFQKIKRMLLITPLKENSDIVNRAEMPIITGLSSQADYRQALRYFLQAEQAYNRAIKKVNKRNLAHPDIALELSRLIKERMMVLHRIGDAYRSCGQYPLAESYYRDVLAGYPTHMRTLVDLSKTYCLANKWASGFEFLQRRVRVIPESASNADANFYFGWVLAGGVASKKYITLRRLARRYFKHYAQHNINHQDQYGKFWRGNFFNSHAILDAQKVFLGRATSHLDYSLYTRPQYFATWRQNNWRYQYANAVKLLAKSEPLKDADTIPEIVNESLDNSSHRYPFQLKYWLLWREYSLLKEHTLIEKNDRETIEKILEHPKIKPMVRLFTTYQIYKKEYDSQFKDIKKSGRFRGIPHAYTRLSLALKMLVIWESATKEIENKSHDVTFLSRLRVDMYSQIAIFSAKVMAEARCFMDMESPLVTTLNHLETWRKNWHDYYKSKEIFFLFSPRVFRFQMSTLYSWQAYALVIGKEDYDVVRPQKPKGDDKDIANGKIIENALQRAIKYTTLHPLALYVQAALYKTRGQYNHSIENLSLLLALLQPLDHNNVLANWQLTEKVPELDTKGYDPDFSYDIDQEEKHQDNSRRYLLSRQEKMMGQNQFIPLMNPAQIHVLMSENYLSSGRYNQSIYHLMQAVGASEYHDIDADILLQIIEQFDTINQFNDAKAIIEGLRHQRFLLEKMTFSAVKQHIPDVLDCVLLTRTSDFDKSLQLGRLTYDKLRELEKKWANHDTFKALYRQRLTDSSNDEKITPTHPLRTCLEDIFVVLESPDILKEAGITASSPLEICLNLWGNHEKFHDVYSKIEEKQLLKHKLTHFLLVAICWDAVILTDFMGRLRNNIAYNAIELNIHQLPDIKLELPQASATASKKETPQRLTEHALNQLKKLYELSLQDHPHYMLERFRRNIALSYDTLGWCKFKYALHNGIDNKPRTNDSVLSNLKRAQRELQTALRYNQQMAIIYYHLARVELALLEFYWYKTNYQQVDKVIEISPAINDLLISSYQNWEQALALDTYKRLSKSLAWLGLRIHEYRAAWRNRHLNTFKG